MSLSCSSYITKAQLHGHKVPKVPRQERHVNHLHEDRAALNCSWCYKQGCPNARQTYIYGIANLLLLPKTRAGKAILGLFPCRPIRWNHVPLVDSLQPGFVGYVVGAISPRHLDGYNECPERWPFLGDGEVGPNKVRSQPFGIPFAGPFLLFGRLEPQIWVRQDSQKTGPHSKPQPLLYVKPACNQSPLQP